MIGISGFAQELLSCQSKLVRLMGSEVIDFDEEQASVLIDFEKEEILFKGAILEKFKIVKINDEIIEAVKCDENCGWLITTDENNREYFSKTTLYYNRDYKKGAITIFDTNQLFSSLSNFKC
tara:strand:+ start:696 stop:1061 length:366 start_codon:yes stop_codon:yes gene_type:complete